MYPVEELYRKSTDTKKTGRP